MRIIMPYEVENIIDTLMKSGYEAYAVGGCVRDSLMGKAPQDWDICTDARPEQTMRVFSDKRVIETGLKHGTLALIIDGSSYEITTFRQDGEYRDNRRPDSVEFVSDIKKDLARRDFTINALAYNHMRGLVDCFGGVSDIENRMLRCVGSAKLRFEEDALRIMRALRFASTLGFEIERETDEAICLEKELLKNISSERISTELSKMLLGESVGKVLLKYGDTLAVVIPEIKPMFGFKQNTPYHYLDVWEHTVKSVEEAPKDLTLRLTMLLHDIGKPSCYKFFDGKGHFHGHPGVSLEMAKRILTRLKYDNNTAYMVTTLVRYHDVRILPESKDVRRWLSRIGEEALRALIEVKRADKLAQAEIFRQPAQDTLDIISKKIDEIITQQGCFSLKTLAVDGSDLIALGIPEGKQIGESLSRLLDMVIDEKLPNDRECLLEYVLKGTTD